MLKSFRYPGQMIVAISLFALFSTMIILGKYVGDWGRMWEILQVTLPNYIWGDLHTVLFPLNCYQHGDLDFASPRCRGWNNTYNYPLLWLQIFTALGITDSDTTSVAISFIAMVAGAFLFIFRKTTAREGLVASLAIISPPVLFGMQRANTEEIIFVMVTWACLIDDTRATIKVWLLRPLLIFSAALLKLYPAMLLVLFFLITDNKKERWVLAILSVLFAVYCFANLENIAFGLRTTMHGNYVAFGANVLPELITYGTPVRDFIVSTHHWMQAGVFATACAAVWHIGKKYAEKYAIISNSFDQNTNALCFTVGAAVIIFVFFVQGNNWSYRLLYLLLCLPQTLRWAASENMHLKNEGKILTVLILLSMWLGNFAPIIGECFTWVLCLKLCIVLRFRIPYLLAKRGWIA